MIRHSIAASALLLVILASTPTFAVTQWQAKPAANSISWTVKSSDPIKGYCKNFTSDIAFDPATLAQSSVKIIIDMTSCRTGVAERDNLLPTFEWFNESKFSKAEFNGTKFRALGGNRYVADGMLTLKGAAKPVMLDFTLDIKGADAHVQGAATIERMNFGVGNSTPGSYVGLDVVVNIDLKATKN